MDMEEKRDIFDRLMHLPVLNIFEPFYKKHKEVLMYLFFGGITFFLNIALYAWLDGMLGINALIANVICWVICVLFQYFTNRTWVFDGQVDSAAGIFKADGFDFSVEDSLPWLWKKRSLQYSSPGLDLTAWQ